jgi:hypothetical protein
MGFGASITRRLEGAHPALFGLYAVFASFTVYFCMYAIRKPFSAGTYPEEILLPIVGGIQLKILYVISQLFGYTLSKFLGIKVVSEMTSGKRALVLMGMLAAALVALLLFAITPAPWSAGFLFLNGIPLGMVWGLVFSFLEGRRTTEALAAGLSASYVLADGAVKTAGPHDPGPGRERGVDAVRDRPVLLPGADAGRVAAAAPAAAHAGGRGGAREAGADGQRAAVGVLPVEHARPRGVDGLACAADGVPRLQLQLRARGVGTPSATPTRRRCSPLRRSPSRWACSWRWAACS